MEKWKNSTVHSKLPFQSIFRSNDQRHLYEYVQFMPIQVPMQVLCPGYWIQHPSGKLQSVGGEITHALLTWARENTARATTQLTATWSGEAFLSWDAVNTRATPSLEKVKTNKREHCKVYMVQIAPRVPEQSIVPISYSGKILAGFLIWRFGSLGKNRQNKFHQY